MENQTTSAAVPTRLFVFCILWANILFVGAAAQAQTTTYTYTGGGWYTIPYYSAIESPSLCPITVSITTPNPIPPNTAAYTGPITSFRYNDCVSTLTQLNCVGSFLLSTNAQGQIGIGIDVQTVQWSIYQQCTLSSPVNIIAADPPVNSYEFLANSVFIVIQNPLTTATFFDQVNYLSQPCPSPPCDGEDGSILPGTWTGGASSSCTNPPQPSSLFHNYDASYPPQASGQPANLLTPQTTLYPNTQPVPQYFGSLPDPNPGNNYVVSPTINYGCVINSTGTMLSTFPNLITTTSLDSDIQALGGTGYLKGTNLLLCPSNNRNCSSPQNTQSYSDLSKMDWEAPVKIEPGVLSFEGAQEMNANKELYDSDQGMYVLLNSYLNDHVCGHQDRVILELNETSCKGATPKCSKPVTGKHFVYVTGQNPTNPNDWNVSDPGWKNAPSTLSGHTAPGGFPTTGLSGITYTRTFTVAGVRPYRANSSSAPQGFVEAIANSPVELLVVDPQGRQLGNLDGTDVFQIPQSSYVRDYPLSDDLEIGSANGDPTGVKTAAVPSPVDGTYQVTATGTGLGTYTLWFSSLGADSTIQNSSVNGVTNTGSTSVYQVSVSSVSGLSGTATVQATFQSALADISNSLALGLIDNEGIANALSSKIQAAHSAAAAAQNQTAVNILGAFENQVNAQSGKHISGVAPEVLLADAMSLINQYQ